MCIDTHLEISRVEGPVLPLPGKSSGLNSEKQSPKSTFHNVLLIIDSESIEVLKKEECWLR